MEVELAMVRTRQTGDTNIELVTLALAVALAANLSHFQIPYTNIGLLMLLNCINNIIVLL